VRAQLAAYTEIRAPRWGKEEREYQIVVPKKAYVYGTGRNNCLIHRISHIKLRWWTPGPEGGYLVRLQSPIMAAVCICGRYIRLSDASGKMCELPKPDAVLCGMCHGKGRNFPHNQKHEVPASLAKIRIGCIEIDARTAPPRWR
jgi:hypothetical protein